MGSGITGVEGFELFSVSGAGEEGRSHVFVFLAVWVMMGASLVEVGMTVGVGVVVVAQAAACPRWRAHSLQFAAARRLPLATILRSLRMIWSAVCSLG